MVSKFRLHAQYDKNCFPDLNSNGIRKSGWLRPKLHLDFYFSCAYTSSQILLRSDSLGQTKIIEIYINTKCDFKIVLSAMWFTVLWFVIDWFLRLPCLQNQQRERFLYITASGGDSKLDFFLQTFPSISQKSWNGKLSYNFLTILLPHVLCAREWEKRKTDLQAWVTKKKSW